MIIIIIIGNLLHSILLNLDIGENHRKHFTIMNTSSMKHVECMNTHLQYLIAYIHTY